MTYNFNVIMTVANMVLFSVLFGTILLFIKRGSRKYFIQDRQEMILISFFVRERESGKGVEYVAEVLRNRDYLYSPIRESIGCTFREVQISLSSDLRQYWRHKRSEKVGQAFLDRSFPEKIERLFNKGIITKKEVKFHLKGGEK